MRTWLEARAGVRQWARPKEFRIRAVAWPAEALRAFEELTTADPEGPNGLPERSVADVATSVWRLRARMTALPERTRSTMRHVEMAWDALEQAGVEIRDHLHEPFDPGLSINVVAFQPTPGLAREQVVETIRPSVYVHDRVVQLAEVIVGTPSEAEMELP
jgi:hypothetical protein